MSIKDIQKNKVINKIIKDQLKDNVNITRETLTYLMYKYFNENNIGMPTFKGLKVGKRTTTNLKEYWDALDNIEWDLDVLYKSMLSQNEKIIESFKEEDMLRKQLVNKLQNVNYKAEETLSISQNTNDYYITDDFNFTNFNNYNGGMTSLIDLNYNSLTLNPQLKKSSQFSIESIVIEDIKNQGSLRINEISSINNCINDYENKSWIQSIKVPKSKLEEFKSTEVILLVELKKESEINQIEIKSNTRDNTYFKIQVSRDKKEWTTVENATGIKKIKEKTTIYFRPIKTRYIRIQLQKKFNENDSTTDGTFLYSLNNISFYRTFYNKSGKVTTNKKSIETGNIIDKITLDAKEHIPNGTDIDYYINIYKGEEKERFKINPVNRAVGKNNQKEINLNNTENFIEQVNHSENIKDRFSVMDAYKIRFYQLDKLLPENIIPKETKIYKGINQWEKSVYQYYRDNTYRISLNDWIQKPVKESDVIRNYHSDITNKKSVVQNIEVKDNDIYPCKFKYIDDKADIDVYNLSTDQSITCDVGQYGTGDSEFYIENIAAEEDDHVVAEYPAYFLNYKFTTWVYSTGDQMFETSKINLNNKYYNDSFEYDSFYINNNRAKKIVEDNQHIFAGKLKKGWNKLDYLCYIKDPKEDSGFLENRLVNILDEEETSITIQAKHHIDLLQGTIIAKAQRAQKESMTYKSVYGLKNNILKEENNYFTIRKMSNGYKAIVNNRELANYAIKYKTISDIYTDYELEIEQRTEDENFTPIVENIFVNFIYN